MSDTSYLLGAPEFFERFAGKFFGKYRALVLDNNDPRQLGRIKVRCEPVYGDDASPWAFPCTPMAGAMDGGFLFIPPVGSLVWVEFEQGFAGNPIYAGGFWTNASVGRPSDGSPIEQSVEHQGNNNPIPLHCQGLPDGSDLDGSMRGNDGVPESNFQGQYPHVRMMRTPSGHYLEFDDTEGEERVQIQHKSGAFIEILADGSINTCAAGKVHTFGKQMSAYCDGSYVNEIQGTKTENIAGDYHINVGGTYVITYGAETVIDYGSTRTENVSGSVLMDVEGTYRVDALSNIEMTASGHMNLGSMGNVNIASGATGLFSFSNSDNIGNPIANTLSIVGQNGLVTIAGQDSTGIAVNIGMEIMPTSSTAPPPASLPVPNVASIGPHIFLGNLTIPTGPAAVPVIQEPMVMGQQLYLYLQTLHATMLTFFSTMSTGGATPGFGGPNPVLAASSVAATTALTTLQSTFLVPSSAQANPMILSDLVYLSKT